MVKQRLSALGNAARLAILGGTDPELALSYVVWPNDAAMLPKHSATASTRA